MILPGYLPNITGTQTWIPDGDQGVERTVQRMRELVDAWKTAPAILQAARTIVYLTPQKDHRSEIIAIYQYVRDSIRYVRDVNGVETLATPLITMTTRQGDCDDKSVLFATLAEAIGFPTRFVVGAFASPESGFDHVWSEVLVDDEWVAADCTEEEHFGWQPPDAYYRAAEDRRISADDF